MLAKIPDDVIYHTIIPYLDVASLYNLYRTFPKYQPFLVPRQTEELYSLVAKNDDLELMVALLGEQPFKCGSNDIVLQREFLYDLLRKKARRILETQDGIILRRHVLLNYLYREGPGGMDSNDEPSYLHFQSTRDEIFFLLGGTSTRKITLEFFSSVNFNEVRYFASILPREYHSEFIECYMRQLDKGLPTTQEYREKTKQKFLQLFQTHSGR